MPPDSSSYSIVSGDTFYVGTDGYDSLVHLNTEANRISIDEQEKGTVSVYKKNEPQGSFTSLIFFIITIVIVLCAQRFPIWFRKLRIWLEEKFPKIKKFNALIAANIYTVEYDAHQEQVAAPGALVYKGKDLQFEDSVLEFVLNKYSPFFAALKGQSKIRFKERVCLFMATKTFIIYDVQGFREMPILISASAIQVSFGLENFMMPHYTTIQVYPKEYIGVNPLRILMGNVQGNCINLAWSYFLEGFQHAKDGKNIGLHEMAHALYGQNTYG